MYAIRSYYGPKQFPTPTQRARVGLLFEGIPPFVKGCVPEASFESSPHAQKTRIRFPTESQHGEAEVFVQVTAPALRAETGGERSETAQCRSPVHAVVTCTGQWRFIINQTNPRDGAMTHLTDRSYNFV